MKRAMVRVGVLTVSVVSAHGAQAQPWGSPYARSTPDSYRQAPQPGYYSPPLAYRPISPGA